MNHIHKLLADYQSLMCFAFYWLVSYHMKDVMNFKLCATDVTFCSIIFVVIAGFFLANDTHILPRIWNIILLPFSS